MTNAEILTIAGALSTDARVMGWTAPNGTTIEIWHVPGGEPVVQLRQTNGPAGVEVLPFPASEAGLAEARAVARLRAELLTMEG